MEVDFAQTFFKKKSSGAWVPKHSRIPCLVKNKGNVPLSLQKYGGYMPGVLPKSAPGCIILLFPKLRSFYQNFAVPRLATNISLSVLWLLRLRSVYYKAHTPSRFSYYSRVHTMKAMLTNSFGPDAQLQLEDIPRPKVVMPDDILVQVVAGSVNPIDLKMIGGYGVKVMNIKRRKDKVCAYGTHHN